MSAMRRDIRGLSALRSVWRVMCLGLGPVLALAALPLLVGTTPAAAADPGPLTISTASGSAGQRVLLSGTGFTPGESVQPYWDYGMTGVLAQKSFYLYNPIVKADANGEADTDLFVPVVPSGAGTISLVGLTSGVVDTAAFTVLPRIDTGAAIAPAGSTLTFGGWGFAAREGVTVQWAGTFAAKASTDAKGSFAGKTFTIPPDTAPGAYTVTATGDTSSITASATVTVGQTPTGPPPGPDDWSQWGFEPQQHRVNTTETAFTAANIPTLTQAWQKAIPGPDKYQATPTVANGIVYIGSVHGLLSAYDEATGTLLWSYQAPGPIYASPAVVNGIAYFGTTNEPQESQAGNYAIALNAQTGAVIWDTGLPDGGDWAQPLVANGEVVFPMANREGVSGGMIAYDAMTGAQVWYHQTNEGIWSAPTLDPAGQYFYEGTGNPCSGTGPSDPIPCAGQMLKVSLADGSFTTLLQTPDLSGDDDVPASPTYDNGNLYFGGKDGIFFSISAATGAVNWEFNTGFIGDFGIFGSSALYNGLVIFESIGAKKVYALNETDGTVAWTHATGGGPNSPVVADGVVFVASYGGKLLALDAASGNLLWSSPLGAPSGGSAAVANGMVFQPAGNGSLYAYSLSGVAITSPASTTAMVGQPFSFTVTTAGSPTPSLSEAGALPSGVTFTDNGDGTATLAGTPDSGQAGSYPITITARNGVASDATQSFTLTVNGVPPGLTADTPATALPINAPYSYTFTASGDPAPAFKVASGTLPTGLTLSPGGVLSGTPSAGGKFTFTVSASNGYGVPAVSPSITITVYAATDMSVKITGPATAKVGATVTYTVTASNLGPASAGLVNATFALPSGASFVSAQNGGSYANGVVTWTVAAIGSGSHTNLKLSIVLSAKGTNTATAAVSAINPDPNPANNSISFNTIVS